MTSQSTTEPRTLPRALLLKVSLPTEGITKTVLVGLNATLADVREKLIGKLSSFQIPPDINNWAFMLTKNIDQMWLDDKVFLKAYNVKDGDILEFKRKARIAAKPKNLGPWVKAAPKSSAIYEHQLDRPASPDPRSLSPAPSSPTTAQRKTSTDKLFDAFFENNKTATSEALRPPTTNLSFASTVSPSVTKPRRNSTRRKSNALVSLLTKSTTKNPPKAATPSVKGKQKINSTESPFTKTISITTPPAQSVSTSPASTSPLPSPTSQPATSKQKKDEITEEEMIAWLEMEENEMKGKSEVPPKVLHDVQEISLDLPAHLSPRDDVTRANREQNEVFTFSATSTPRDEYDDYSAASTPRDDSLLFSATSTPRDQMYINTKLKEIYGAATPRDGYDTSATSTPRYESDSYAQVPKLTSGYIEKSKSSPNTPRMIRSDSVEDGYVRQQVEKFDPNTSDFKERKAKRRSRTTSDARISMMIKRTAEMEQQFNTYIETLSESLDKNEKTLDTVQALLYQMIKRIDEGNLDVKGARRYAKNALDVMLAAAKK